MTIRINVPGTTSVIIGGGGDDGGETEGLLPEITFGAVFGDNTLSTAEKTSDQTISAQVENALDEAYNFEFYNVAIGGAPVLQKGGNTSTAQTISVTLTPTEMLLFTSINCRIDLVFSGLGVTATRPFTNDQGQAPDAPIVDDITVNMVRPTLTFIAALRPTDSVSAQVGTDSYIAIQDPENANEYYVNLLNDLVDGNTYTFTATVTGADGQTASDSGTITVTLSSTVETRIIEPVNGDTSTGDTLPVSWDESVPPQYGMFVVAWPADQTKDDYFFSYHFVRTVDGNSGVITGIPTDGSQYKVEISEIPDNGSGGPEFNRDRRPAPTIIDMVSAVEPSIVSPEDDSVVDNPLVVSWSAGSAPGDEYEVTTGTRFDVSAQYRIQELLGLTTPTAALTGLPNNGDSVYMKLRTRTGANWIEETIHFASGNSGGVSVPTFISPAQLSSVIDTGVNVGWSANSTSASEWWLHAGTSAGAEDLYDSGRITDGSATNHVIPSGTLPANGSIVYLKLSFKVSGSWDNVQMCFTSGQGAVVDKPVITTPAPSAVVEGAAITATWASSSFDADTWTIRSGSAQNGSDYDNEPGIPITQLSQSLTGHPADGTDIFVTMASVKTGVETVHSERVYRDDAVIVQVGGHQLNQGVGIVTSTTGMTTLNNTIYERDKNGLVIENMIIRPPESGENGGQGAISLKNCTNCTIQNLVIVCPSGWYWNARNSYSELGLGILIDGGHSNRIENVNVFGGYQGYRIRNSDGFIGRKMTSGGAFAHQIIMNGAKVHGTQPYDVDGFNCWSRHDAVRPAKHGSMDNMNFISSVLPPNGIQHTCRNYYAHGGHSNTGSGNIIDGWDQNGPQGGCTFRDGVLMDNGLKAFGIAAGSRNEILNVDAYQDTDSPTTQYALSNTGGYVADFKNSYKVGDETRYRAPDANFGNHRIENCNVHWTSADGNHYPVNLQSTAAVFWQGVHPTPYGTFVNNKFDKSFPKNFVTPSVTRQGARARALQLTANQISFDVPEAYNMAWANIGT